MGCPDGTLQQTFPGSGDAETEDYLRRGAAPQLPPAVLTFYANDYVIDESTGARYNFLRDGSGVVIWLRFSGRLYRRGG